MSLKPQTFTLDTVPLDVLRIWYANLLERHQDGRDDRHLGWWITHNAEEVTIRTRTGDVISGTGAEMLGKLKAYADAEATNSAWRAA